MRSRSFKRLLGAMLGTVLMAAPASARAPEPALWQIKNGDSTVYLLGSIHVLPTNWGWRTKPISAAISSADVFVFESLLTPYSLGQTKVFIRQNGTLPRGKHLSTMLSPEGQEDFKAVLASVPIDPDSINVMRPWLKCLIQLLMSALLVLKYIIPWYPEHYQYYANANVAENVSLLLSLVVL